MRLGEETQRQGGLKATQFHTPLKTPMTMFYVRLFYIYLYKKMIEEKQILNCNEDTYDRLPRGNLFSTSKFYIIYKKKKLLLRKKIKASDKLCCSLFSSQHFLLAPESTSWGKKNTPRLIFFYIHFLVQIFMSFSRFSISSQNDCFMM